MSKVFLFITTFFMLYPSADILAAPLLIDYQGYLEDNNGNAITDTVAMTFIIYANSDGTDIKWTETQPFVEVKGGLFNVTLGSSTTLSDSVFNENNRWLKVIVAGNELSPLTRIISTPYSLRVNTIDGASGGTLNGDISASNGNFGFSNNNQGISSLIVGDSNIILANWSSICGGKNNSIRGNFSIINGGSKNTTGDSGWISIGGGYSNTASGNYSTISGGIANEALGYYATVGGGQQNLASWSAATVCGGYKNTASGGSSIVVGGSQNEANGDYSLAAGRFAKANHIGTFVWSDASNIVFSSSRANEFNIRASGGTRIFSNSSFTAGVTLSPGGSAWNSVSDSTLKRNKRLVDGKEILSKLMQLPIKRWSYKAQDPSIEHIGPMAQDFFAIFGLGDNNKTISSIDPAGIALAAIQELTRRTQELQEKTEKIESMEAQLYELKTQLAKLWEINNISPQNSKEYLSIHVK